MANKRVYFRMDQFPAEIVQTARLMLADGKRYIDIRELCAKNGCRIGRSSVSRWARFIRREQAEHPAFLLGRKLGELLFDMGLKLEKIN